MFLISIVLSVISQIPSINPSVEPSKVAIFLSNFPEEKNSEYLYNACSTYGKHLVNIRNKLLERLREITAAT